MAQDQAQRVVTGHSKMGGISVLFAQGVAISIHLNSRDIQHVAGTKAQRPMFPEMGVTPDPPMHKPHLVCQPQICRLRAQLQGGVKTHAMRLSGAGETAFARKFEQGLVAAGHGIGDRNKANLFGDGT
jgi:hypothetical protein